LASCVDCAAGWQPRLVFPTYAEGCAPPLLTPQGCQQDVALYLYNRGRWATNFRIKKPPQRSCRRRLLGGGRASMDDWNVRLTMAATIATLPRRQGRRKCTVSTLAVTTGPRATVLAARPAQMSIQLSTCGPPGTSYYWAHMLLTLREAILAARPAQTSVRLSTCGPGGRASAARCGTHVAVGQPRRGVARRACTDKEAHGCLPLMCRSILSHKVPV